MDVYCHRPFLPGTSLEPAVIPTAQASSFTDSSSSSFSSFYYYYYYYYYRIVVFECLRSNRLFFHKLN